MNTAKFVNSWPPPPDIASIRELVASADVEGFIADGAPTDEYEVEAELLFNQLAGLSTDALITPTLLPILEDTWRRSFELGDAGVSLRRPKLTELAAQIERFFGPAARPQVRGA